MGIYIADRKKKTWSTEEDEKISRLDELSCKRKGGRGGILGFMEEKYNQHPSLSILYWEKCTEAGSSNLLTQYPSNSEYL